MTATHSYNFGLLTSVTYNDGVTPNVTYNYNAFSGDNNHIPGDLETVTRGGAGSGFFPVKLLERIGAG